VYWYLARDWSSSGSYVWNTTGAAKGDYAFKVQIKNSDSLNAFDTEWVQDSSNTGVGSTTSVAWAAGSAVPNPNLTLHGPSIPGCSNCFPHGLVLHNPSVVLIFWGSAWSTGWTDSQSYQGCPPATCPYTYGSTTAINYMTTLFRNIANKSWTQSWGRNWCDGGTIGDSTCPAGTSKVGNGNTSDGANSVIYGVYVDTVDPPGGSGGPTDAQLQTEAIHVAHDTNIGFNANSNYMIFLPPGVGATNRGYPTYHGGFLYPYVSSTVQTYTVMSDYTNWANTGAVGLNSLGNVYYDEYGTTATHEFTESATDPVPGYLGWLQSSGPQNENADACQAAGLRYYHIVSAPANGSQFVYFKTQPTVLNVIGCNSW
jgi:hypothetical protein